MKAIFLVGLWISSAIAIRYVYLPDPDSNKRESSGALVVGGARTAQGQFPWMVSIQATNFEDGWHLCGGALITPTWVLTAAHCLDSEKPEWLWIVTGEQDMDKEDGTEQRLRTDYFVKHPDYKYWQKPYQNDIALIHLSTFAELDELTGTLELPPVYYVPTGACYEAGWGSPAEGSAGSSVLNYVRVPILDPNVCDRTYGDSSDPGRICAGSLKGGSGFCVGDNGGPLSCEKNDGSGRYVVTGVMSWREGCAETNNPGVYMNTTYYMNWIDEIIGREFALPLNQPEANEEDFRDL